MANYSTGMLANLNGQQNYFEPIAAEAEEQPASQEPPAEETAGSGMFPPPDPTGASVLQKTLLPFDDHPFSQVRSRPGYSSPPHTASCRSKQQRAASALAPADDLAHKSADHACASQSLRTNPRRQPGAMAPELERRVTAERRGRGGGSAQTSSLGPSHTQRGFFDHMEVEKGCFPEPITGYGGFRPTTNLTSK